MSEQTSSAKTVRLTLEKAGTIATFSSLIETYRLSGHEALNAQLRKEIAAWRETEKGVQISNLKGWHSSSNLFSRPEPAIRQLCEVLRQSILGYVKRYEGDFDPAMRDIGLSGWANVNGKGAFNAPHAHAYFHISGCYYVSVPEPTAPRSGMLEFLSPLVTFSLPMKFGARVMPQNYQLQPEEGMIVLFPSYLQHWVHPNEEDEDRISVAFNALIQDQPPKSG